MPLEPLFGTAAVLILVAFVAGWLCARDLYARRRRRDVRSDTPISIPLP